MATAVGVFFSSRVAEARAVPWGAGELSGGHPPLFLGGLGHHSWLPGLGQRGLRARLTEGMCPGEASLGSNQDLLYLAHPSFSFASRFLHLSVWPWSGYRSVLGLLAAPGGRTRSLELGPTSVLRPPPCSLLDSAEGPGETHTAAGWGTGGADPSLPAVTRCPSACQRRPSLLPAAVRPLL